MKTKFNKTTQNKISKTFTIAAIASILIGSLAAANTQPALALTVIDVYDDNADFLSDTGASSVGAIPDSGKIGNHLASDSIGEATFSTVHNDQALYFGDGLLNVPNLDWTTLTTGNDIALSDDEDLNISLANPVYSLGFEFVEPSCTIKDGANLCGNGDVGSNVLTANTVDSEFEVTLKNSGNVVEVFTFNVPDDQLAFVGVWSNDPFDSVEIRETTGTNDNEYYGEFFTGDIPRPPFACSEEDEICKYVDIDDVNGGNISVGDHIIYEFFIEAVNTSNETWVDVEVKDRFGGELAVGDTDTADLTMWDHLQEDILLSLDNLDCELSQFGKKAQKEKLDCALDSNENGLINDVINIDGVDLLFSPGETASVGVVAETDYNHGQSKKEKKPNSSGIREYTSCGVHSINSGATVSYYFESDDQSVDPRSYATTGPIYVEVYEYDDLSGDCDMDGTIDLEDFYPFDKDDDAIPDLFDNCIDTPNFNQADFDGDGIGDACDLDDDNDGINDDVDQCDFEPETVNGYLDEDGCADVAP